MKYAGMLILAVAVFIAAMFVPLALTGNLNKAALDKLMGKEIAEPAGDGVDEDAGALIAALKQRENELRVREARLKEQEEQLLKRERDLAARRAELEELLKQVDTALETEDQQQVERNSAVAKMLASMKPAEAAKSLEMLEPERAAALLRQIKEKDSGDILNSMDEEKRTRVLILLQEPKL